MDRMKSKNKIIIIAIVSAIIIALGLYTFNILGGEGNTEGGEGPKKIFNIGKDDNIENGGIKTRTKEEIEEDLNKKVAESMMNISMNMNPTFKNGKSAGNLLIVNEEKNNNIQVIEIHTVDGELIYTSGGIPVGSKLETAKLDVELTKGNYKSIATFNAVTEEGVLIGKAKAEILITILE